MDHLRTGADVARIMLSCMANMYNDNSKCIFTPSIATALSILLFYVLANYRVGTWVHALLLLLLLLSVSHCLVKGQSFACVLIHSS